MKKRTVAVLTNVCLAAVLLAVGAVCFFPFGVSTAGRLSDRVYYGGDKDGRYISVMFNVYWGTEYLPSILDTLDEYGVKATFVIGGSWADGNTEMPAGDRLPRARAGQSRLFPPRSG